MFPIWTHEWMFRQCIWWNIPSVLKHPVDGLCPNIHFKGTIFTQWGGWWFTRFSYLHECMCRIHSNKCVAYINSTGSNDVDAFIAIFSSISAGNYHDKRHSNKPFRIFNWLHIKWMITMNNNTKTQSRFSSPSPSHSISTEKSGRIHFGWWSPIFGTQSMMWYSCDVRLLFYQ